MCLVRNRLVTFGQIDKVAICGPFVTGECEMSVGLSYVLQYAGDCSCDPNRKVPWLG